MAEGNGLLNRHTLLRGIEGSNPSLSAAHLFQITRPLLSLKIDLIEVEGE